MNGTKRAFYAILIVIAVLSLLNVACDDVSTGRFGDAARIGEALEAAQCKSDGGTWDAKKHVCRDGD